MTSDRADDVLVDVRDAAQNSKGRLTRRITIAVLTVIVALGAAGVFGIKSATVTSSAGGYDLTVLYGRISRAGLDTPWEVTVHHTGGFSGDLVLATTTDYFDMFETQGLTPDPDSQTTGATDTYDTFTAPQGDTLHVIYDGYIQPSSQRGYRATTTLYIGGHAVTSVSYRTRLVP